MRHCRTIAFLGVILALGAPARTGSPPESLEKSNAKIAAGEEALKDGDVKAALKRFDEAVHVCPTNADAYLHRGAAQKRQVLTAPVIADAMADIDKAIELNPTSADAFLERGRTRVAEATLKPGDNGESLKSASEDFTKAIELNPVLAAARVARARLERDAGQTKEALEDLNAALKLNDKDEEALELRAQVQKDLRNWSLQLEDLTRLIDTFAATPDRREARGEAYLHLGENDKALADFAAAVYAREKRPAPAANGVKPMEAAELALLESLQRQALSRAYLGKARALGAKTEYDRALEAFVAALKVSEQNIDVFCARGEMYQTMGSLDKAAEDFHRAIKLAGGDAKAANRSAARLKTLEAQQKQDEDKAQALELASEATHLDPGYARAYGIEGKLLAGKGDDDGAIKSFTTVIQLDPNNADAYNARANSYLAKRDAKSAIADLQRATSLRRDDAGFWTTLGQLHFRLKQYHEALGCYEQLNRLAPDQAMNKFMIAILYAVMDQPDLASASLEPGLFRAQPAEVVAAARIAESVLKANPTVPALRAVTERLREKAGLSEP